MRKLSLLGVLAATAVITEGLGKPLFGVEGKFSISNIAPLLFVIIAAPCFLVEVKSVQRNVLTLIGFFNVCAVASFLIFLFRYGWVPNLPVLAFQDVEILFALLLIWYARNDPDEFFAVVKFGIYCSALLSVMYGLQESGGGHKVWIMEFSMDDKSQAAVLFCCQAYILLRFYDGFLPKLVAAMLLGMSLMTISRLPAAFLPLMLVTLAIRTRYGIVLSVMIVAGIVTALVAFGDELTLVFTTLDRVSSVQTVTGSAATTAHLLLIKSALEVKFNDLAAFFFGTGPGNFSKALTSFPLDIHELQSLDPALVADARVGRAPMHSTPVSLLLDYNIVLFGLLVYLALRAIRYLLQTRHFLDLFFFVTLFAASTFYSLHNKPYFFLSIATVAVGTMVGVRNREPVQPPLRGPEAPPLATS